MFVSRYFHRSSIQIICAMFAVNIHITHMHARKSAHSLPEHSAIKLSLNAVVLFTLCAAE